MSACTHARTHAHTDATSAPSRPLPPHPRPLLLTALRRVAPRHTAQLRRAAPRALRALPPAAAAGLRSMGGGGGAMPADAEEAPELPPLRLLCLHGRTQTGEGFAARLRPALRRLRGVLGAARFPDATGGAAGGGLQWYGGSGGADEAVRRLEGELQRVPPFDGVLGFSQVGVVPRLKRGRARVYACALSRAVLVRAHVWVMRARVEANPGGAPTTTHAGRRAGGSGARGGARRPGCVPRARRIALCRACWRAAAAHWWRAARAPGGRALAALRWRG